VRSGFQASRMKTKSLSTRPCAREAVAVDAGESLVTDVPQHVPHHPNARLRKGKPPQLGFMTYANATTSSKPCSLACTSVSC